MTEPETQGIAGVTPVVATKGMYMKAMLVQCPTRINWESSEHNPENSYFLNAKKIFLAGGISNCPLWQDEMVDRLSNQDVIILNPRRPEGITLTDEEQIGWEYEYLRHANIISFYFPKETLCPITLFEYGYWLGKDKKIIVAAHPEYQRRNDLIIQTRLTKRNIEILNSLDELIKHVVNEVCPLS